MNLFSSEFFSFQTIARAYLHFLETASSVSVLDWAAMMVNDLETFVTEKQNL